MDCAPQWGASLYRFFAGFIHEVFAKNPKSKIFCANTVKRQSILKG
jgi:hypothetical protein